MSAAMDISVTRVERSKLQDLDMENLPFGKFFTDHMLEADFENGEWKNIEIKPYQPLLLSPSVAALHYGQAIFEGLKATMGKNNTPLLFRPDENAKRMNVSAYRMGMPNFPEDLFVEGLKQLVALEKNWVPTQEGSSLYLRPFMVMSFV